jgi:ketosteroid isomerase-like protein
MSTEATSKNEQLIRNLYQLAEVKDIKGFVDQFTEDGVFYDVPAGKKYYGKEIGDTVEIYATAFPDMHRELYDVYLSGDVVVVELSLNGTHNGPLVLPMGTIPPTGRKMTTPCCDVFKIKNGKVQVFDCYPAATRLLEQIGVLHNLSAVLQKK